jgi:ABC-type sugar transport system permease subunit/ABC-type glycerol-3-phosphate transport system substrate-binding protein
MTAPPAGAAVARPPRSSNRFRPNPTGTRASTGRPGARQWRAVACALGCLIGLSPAFEAAAASNAAVRDGGEGDRELVVWGAWRRRGLDAAFRRFEKEHPGWKIITSTAVGAGQMDPQKLMCAIAGGSPPDTLIQDRLSIGEWALRDTFLPLDGMIRTSQRREALAIAARDAIARLDVSTACASLEELISGLQLDGESLQLNLAREFLTGITYQRKINAVMQSRAQELVNVCQAIRSEQFYTACWEEACFGSGPDRRTYAVPNTTDVRLLYYNEDLLERAGFVDAEGRARPPRDWDELRDYAVKLSERDASGKFVRVGFGPLLGQGFLYHYSWLNGGEFVTPDGRTCTLDAPANVEALSFVVDLYDRLGGMQRIDGFKGTFQAGELDPFLVGKVAMTIDSDYFQSIIADFAPRMRFAVAPPPAPKGKESVTWSGGFSWVIPTGAKHPEMAFELIRFLNSDRTWELRNAVEERYAASRGTSFIPEMAPLPHVNLLTYDHFVRDNPNLPERFKRHLLLFADMMKTSRYRPVTPVGQLLWDEHLRAAEKATRHTLTPAEALRRGREAVQKQLDAVHKDVAVNAAASRAGTSGRASPIVVASITAAALLIPIGFTLFAACRSGSGFRAETLWGFAFASPWLIGLVVLTVGPMVASIVYSFCQYDGLHAAKFTGLENYRRLLTQDPLFWRSLGNTAFMMLGVPLGLAAGLAIAMLLNCEVRGMRVYRTVFYLPAIVPVVASALLWIWVLNPEIGLVNSLLRMLGVTDPPGWLNSPSWLFGSKTAIIFMGLWGAGSSMIIWLAGLKGIPRHLYEAAEIDGAGPWRRFRNVTLPMLSPYLFFNLIIGVIGTMQIFSQAYIMTMGGPDDSTLFYAYHLFNTAFRHFQMGYASAMAWILFLIILALTLVQMWLGRRWVHYETA